MLPIQRITGLRGDVIALIAKAGTTLRLPGLAEARGGRPFTLLPDAARGNGCKGRLCGHPG
jgi:hypothetical protein